MGIEPQNGKVIGTDEMPEKSINIQEVEEVKDQFEQEESGEVESEDTIGNIIRPQRPQNDAGERLKLTDINYIMQDLLGSDTDEIRVTKVSVDFIGGQRRLKITFNGKHSGRTLTLLTDRKWNYEA